RSSRLRLRECGRACGMEGHVAFDFLHGLMNVAIQDRDRSKLLQIRKRLPTILRAPSPILIYRPERNVGENDNRGAVRKMLDVFFHPLELLGPQRSQATRFEVHNVHQTDKMNALLLEAVPSGALSVFAETIEVAFAVVINHVVFAGNVEDVLSRSSL